MVYAMYCEDDLKSKNCDECGRVADEGGCVAVDSKTGKSGITLKFMMLEMIHGNTLYLLTLV